jgi:hypothetical protein
MPSLPGSPGAGLERYSEGLGGGDQALRLNLTRPVHKADNRCAQNNKGGARGISRPHTMTAALLLLAGCATSHETYTPSGQKGYTIDCSGAVQNWGVCQQKAGELCGSRGYAVLSTTGDQGTIVSGNEFGVYGGTVITRSMLIACKQ